MNNNININVNTIRFDFDRRSNDIFRESMRKYSEFINVHNVVYESKLYHVTDTWYYMYVMFIEE